MVNDWIRRRSRSAGILLKYVSPSTAPENLKEFQSWVLDEFRHVTDALSQIETDTLLLKEFNAEPAKLYNGLLAYADGTNFNPGLDRGLYAYLNGKWQIATPVIRSIRLRLQPGATPNTNINVSDRSATAGTYNPPTITNAVNMAKSASSGSFSLNSSGTFITFDVTETILGIIGSNISIHDVNSSSTSEVYFAQLLLSGGNIRIFVNLRGSSSDVDWTTILDVGDIFDLTISFVTDS